MIPAARTQPIRTVNLKHLPWVGIALWVCMWLNLNTGFYNIARPGNPGEWQLLIRAILPFFVLPAAAFFLLMRGELHLPATAPSRMLMVYGLLATLASIFSPEPLWALYWSAAFVASILAAWTFIDRRDPVASARWLLQITWVATFIVAAIIARQASASIFGHLQSGYSAVNAEVEHQSRSSGVARWAAVPGLVSLIRAYHSRRPVLIAFYLGIAAVAFFIVYRMQSRGAVFGAAAALLFALLISSRMRRYALPFALIAVVLIVLLDSPATLSKQVTTYLERGQTKEQFLSMTGRTRAYAHGVAAFKKAPLLGRGQWADRLIIHEHVHNSYLQALMNAGIIGGIPYLASWAGGWILFFRLLKREAGMSPEDRTRVLEAGTVMMFFTVRSVPETTTASFAVDLLVMVAVYVYFEALASATVFRPLARFAPRPARACYPVQAVPARPAG
jgi:O-antigen ligase